MPFDLQRHKAGKRRAPSACFNAIFLFSYVCRWHCLRLCRVPVYLILGSIRKRRRSRQNRGEIWAKTWTFPDISRHLERGENGILTMSKEVCECLRQESRISV